MAMIKIDSLVCSPILKFMHLHKVLTTLIILSLFGCNSDLAHYKVPSNSYVIEGRNYTFAVYNSENRLITHPLRDLRHEIERRKNTGAKPLSDVYVISHGWNYSGGVAVTNYHNYIELLDTLMAENKAKKEYQPFLIFITWTSTVRPLGDIANAVLPLNTHELLRPLTSLIDGGPVHLLTAWKQSLNAGIIALGRFGPDAYLETDWNDEAYTYQEGWYGERDTGQDLPMSQLVYELINSKVAKVISAELTPTEKAVKSCLSKLSRSDSYFSNQDFENLKIHLVGHSYGAKLIALAGMEGLRKFVLRKYLNYPVDKNVTGENWKAVKQCLHPLTSVDKADTILSKLREEKSRSMESVFGDQPAAEKVIDSLLKENSNLVTNSPIESLVLYSPAMHTGEFEYPINFPTFATSSTLRLISRKAIIYSRYDRANGFAFNFRDLMLNGQVAQSFQSQVGPADMVLESVFKTSAFRMGTAALSGIPGVAYSILYGAVYYTGSFLLYTPADLYHHINHNTFNGLFDPPIKSGLALATGKRLLNAADYFVPVLPFVLSRQEDESGIFRLVRPSIGKVGIHRIAVGRWKPLSLWNLKGFYDDSRDINSDLFCKFSSVLNPDTTPMGDSGSKDEILSFDASSVYNSWRSVDGSHGDLRDLDQASCNPDQAKNLQKRQHSMLFLVNFTTSNYMKWLQNN